MQALLKDIHTAVINERQRADMASGRVNASEHESYALILEEFEEASEEESAFYNLLAEYFTQIRRDTIKTNINRKLSEMQEHAERAAAEYVQVAAMCSKAQRTGV